MEKAIFPPLKCSGEIYHLALSGILQRAVIFQIIIFVFFSVVVVIAQIQI